MSITVQDVEALRSLLAELPRHEAREVTKQEAVALLAGEIRAAQRRGYPPEEIARILSERGVPINVATLRGYLRRTRKVRKAPRKRAMGAEQRSTPALRKEAPSNDGAVVISPAGNDAAIPAPPSTDRAHGVATVASDMRQGPVAPGVRR